MQMWKSSMPESVHFSIFVIAINCKPNYFQNEEYHSSNYYIWEQTQKSIDDIVLTEEIGY